MLTYLSLRRLSRLIVAVFAAITVPGMALAQSNTGTITGRVLNTGTGEFVRNVEVRVQGTNISTSTTDGGYYYLNNVPVGETTIIATYPGAEPVASTVNVTAGGTVTSDLEFSLSGGRSADVVQLGKFIVETEREGQSKMVAEQKQALNMKQVVSTDNFGDMSEQNVGEFLKYLPGITIDYVETDTRAASMMGMDPKYGYVTLDGNPQASGDSGAFGGNTRQFEFESISMNNIESVEVNKTLLPDMWADAPAGTVNLRTRSAIDQKRPKFGFQAGFIFNALEATSPWKKTPRHDDDEHAKMRPRLSFDYSSGPILGGKIGFTLNGSFTNIYKLQHRHSIGYDYTSTTARAAGSPLVTDINYKDGPKISEKSAGGIKVDYEPFRGLRITGAASYSYFDDFFANRNLNFRTTARNLGAGSSMTRVVANLGATGNNDTRIEQTGESTGKHKDNTNLSLLATWRRGPWVVDISTLYSRARQSRGGDVYGTIGNTPVRLDRIGFIAERPDVESPAWSFVQTAGPNWYDWNSWGLTTGQDVNFHREIGVTTMYTGKIDVSRAMSWSIPTTYKFGVAENVMHKNRKVPFRFTGRYVGPTNNALTNRMPLSKATFNIDDGFGGGIGTLPVVDKEAMYALWRDHPTWFSSSQANQADMLNQVLGSFQGNQEDVRAAYVMQTSKIKKLQLAGGVRFENTRTSTRVPNEVPVVENPYATRGNATASDGTRFTTYTPANTPEYASYRWSRGMTNTWGSYSDWMPSIAAKYPITSNLFWKLGYNKAIKRPDLNRTAGPWTISTSNDLEDAEVDVTITVPNPAIKPERSQTFSSMLEYYFKNAGSLSLHMYEVDIDDAIEDTASRNLTAADVGLFDPIYDSDNFEFRTYQNLTEKRIVRGWEISYNQQLRFLSNKYLRAFSVNANYAQRSASPRPRTGTRFFPRAASGGVTWSYGKYYVGVNGTWTDETFVSETAGVTGASPYLPGAPEYYRPRTIVFLNLRYRLNQNLSVFVSGDRAYDSGKIWMFKDGRMRQIENYGSQWSFGVRGDY